MRCPGSTETGCRCPEHHPGLLAITREENKLPLAAALKHLASPVTLRVLTTDPKPDDNLVDIVAAISCNGSMTCRCDGCLAERAVRVRRGGRKDNFGGMPIKVRKAA